MGQVRGLFQLVEKPLENEEVETALQESLEKLKAFIWTAEDLKEVLEARGIGFIISDQGGDVLLEPLTTAIQKKFARVRIGIQVDPVSNRWQFVLCV